MKYTDYKWWFVRRDNDGFITEVAVRFYEGDYQTVKDMDDKDVIRYIREKKLKKSNLKHLDKGKDGKDIDGEYIRTYLPEDFGQIKTDDELIIFCNSQLAKDTKHNKIPEQEVV